MKAKLIFLWITAFNLFGPASILQAAAETLKLDADRLEQVKQQNGPETSLQTSAPAPKLALPIPNWTPLSSSPYEQQLSETLWKAADKAGDLAKTVSHTIGDYVKERQIEKKQEEIVQNFYMTLYRLLRPLELTGTERKRLTANIEKLYIEDAQTHQYHLDTLQFRELPQLVKKEYAEIILDRATEGVIDTYYLSGAVKTRWNFSERKPHGAAVTYYENGEILYIDLYDHGEKVSRKKFNEEGKLEFEQNYNYEMTPEVINSRSNGNSAEKKDLLKNENNKNEEEENSQTKEDLTSNQDDDSTLIPVIIR